MNKEFGQELVLKHSGSWSDQALDLLEKFLKKTRVEFTMDEFRASGWVDENGKFIEKKFKDTYELYEVSANKLGVVDNRFGDSRPTFVHFVKFKDTSTDREYTIWVDAQSVYRANDVRENRWYSSSEDYGKKINSIQAIAWTIQTNIPKDCIEKIVRQGDCIMIKKTHSGVHADEVRHLTEKEYRELSLLTR
mgnify:CR=1 FL=1